MGVNPIEFVSAHSRSTPEDLSWKEVANEVYRWNDRCRSQH